LSCESSPLFVPSEETSAWVWLPFGDPAESIRDQLLSVLEEGDPVVSVALGEPFPGLAGFRRTHLQALSAQNVALLAGHPHARVTPFWHVAPVAMMSADVESVRAWVHETLGSLAVDSLRHARLRETAQVFLRTGGSYAATAEKLVVHRNTAQYRVQKAEEIRGRPLRDGRLDVELALLACQWLGKAVLQPRSGET
jgi:DNA-binding PucR family transcriptional regulator